MSRAEPTNMGEQTVRVLDEAYKTIRSGAPGLSDQTCNVLAGSIARKVSIIYVQPQPSQQAGTDRQSLNEAAGVLGWFSGLARKNGHHTQADWLDSYIAALKPVEG